VARRRQKQAQKLLGGLRKAKGSAGASRETTKAGVDKLDSSLLAQHKTSLRQYVAFAYGEVLHAGFAAEEDLLAIKRPLRPSCMQPKSPPMSAACALPE
jgi:hypothetical protein